MAEQSTSDLITAVICSTIVKVINVFVGTLIVVATLQFLGVI